MAGDSPGDSTVLSARHQALACDLDSLNQGVALRDISSPGEEMLENTIDGCLQELSDLQLNKVLTFISAMNLLKVMLSESLNW